MIRYLNAIFMLIHVFLFGAILLNIPFCVAQKKKVIYKWVIYNTSYTFFGVNFPCLSILISNCTHSPHTTRTETNAQTQTSASRLRIFLVFVSFNKQRESGSAASVHPQRSLLARVHGPTVNWGEPEANGKDQTGVPFIYRRGPHQHNSVCVIAGHLFKL